MNRILRNRVSEMTTRYYRLSAMSYNYALQVETMIILDMLMKKRYYEAMLKIEEVERDLTVYNRYSKSE